MTKMIIQNYGRAATTLNGAGDVLQIQGKSTTQTLNTNQSHFGISR